MVREGLSTDKALALAEALAEVPEVDDPGEQAQLLLASLSESYSDPGADERLKEQIASVVMGAATQFGKSLSAEGAATAEAEMRWNLLETAAASRQLLEESDATSESVAALVAEVPSSETVPDEEVFELVWLEKRRNEASTLICLDPAFVIFGEEYYCPDGSRRVGSLQTTDLLPFYSQDGQVDCVTNESVRGAVVATLPAKVILGQTVAGAEGVVRLPDPGKVLTGESFGALDALTGTVVLPAASTVVAGTNYGPGAATAGTYSPDFPDAANVRSTDTTNGAAGTLGDCTIDGDEGCVVPLSVAIKAADTSSLSEWDIRRKRASDGSVITFAGFEGHSKSCRNRANLTTGLDTTNSDDAELPYNNSTAPASGLLVPDFFDSIDDANDSQEGLPPDIVPWSIPGVAGTHGGDFTCGSIYATGAKDYSDASPCPTGADATLNHDPNGNWQDLTPGIVPGGADSTNTAPGCNAVDKFCVFRELSSDMMVTEVSSNFYTWDEAITYCHNLGDAAGFINSPIPTLDVGLGTAHSDWRLPTQKELAHLWIAGLRGLNQTTSLVTSFGNISVFFWSATSRSADTTVAWTSNMGQGNGGFSPKTNVSRAVCVR